MLRRRLWPLAAGVVAALALVGAAAVWSPGAGASGAGQGAAAHAPEPMLRVELRSWVVAGRGRHLYAQIIPPEDAPPEIAALADVIEYWSTAQRLSYRAPAEFERIERIAKMPRGQRARPMFVEPDNRLEAEYEVTASQARELARDRMFAERYILLGPNSTSGLRAAFLAAGLEFPAHVLLGRGVLGEFPGVDLEPGAEIPGERWSDFGLRDGPEMQALPQDQVRAERP